MHMLRSLNMKTTVRKSWLLDTLRKNRSQHEGLYDEAVQGYVAQTKSKLEKALEALVEGKVTSVTVNLVAPTLHLTEYDTVIGMLENNVDETITLSAAEYRMMVEDEWDWMNQWLFSNSGYSASTRAIAEAKGLEVS